MNGRTTDIPKGAGVQRAYETIRGKILNLELKPGMELEESRLVKLLGVSRTPVREALIRLGSEGLVSLMPNQSARVAALELGDLRQFLEALDFCQRMLTGLAARRRGEDRLRRIEHHMARFEIAAEDRDADAMIEENRRFHQEIGDAADNAYLARTYDRLLVEGLRIARVCFAYDADPRDPLAEHLDRTVREHRAMFDAIQRRDAAAAEEVAVQHSRLFRGRIAHKLTEIDFEADTVRFAL